jgi:hypothetical protein
MALWYEDGEATGSRKIDKQPALPRYGSLQANKPTT